MIMLNEVLCFSLHLMAGLF